MITRCTNCSKYVNVKLLTFQKLSALTCEHCGGALEQMHFIEPDRFRNNQGERFILDSLSFIKIKTVPA